MGKGDSFGRVRLTTDMSFSAYFRKFFLVVGSIRFWFSTGVFNTVAP